MLKPTKMFLSTHLQFYYFMIISILCTACQPISPLPTAPIPATSEEETLQLAPIESAVLDQPNIIEPQPTLTPQSTATRKTLELPQITAEPLLAIDSTDTQATSNDPPARYDPLLAIDLFQDHAGIVLLHTDDVTTVGYQLTDTTYQSNFSLIQETMDNLGNEHFEGKYQIEAVLFNDLFIFDQSVTDLEAQIASWEEVPLLDTQAPDTASFASWPIYHLPFVPKGRGSEVGVIDKIVIERLFDIKQTVPCEPSAEIETFLQCAEITQGSAEFDQLVERGGRVIISGQVGNSKQSALIIFGAYSIEPFNCSNTRVVEYSADSSRSMLITNCGGNHRTSFLPIQFIFAGACDQCPDNTICVLDFLCIKWLTSE